MTKPNSGEKGCIWLTSPDHSPSLWKVRTGTHNRNFEAGIGTETMEVMLLASVFHGLFSMLSYTA